MPSCVCFWDSLLLAINVSDVCSSFNLNSFRFYLFFIVFISYFHTDSCDFSFLMLSFIFQWLCNNLSRIHFTVTYSWCRSFVNADYIIVKLLWHANQPWLSSDVMVLNSHWIWSCFKTYELNEDKYLLNNSQVSKYHISWFIRISILSPHPPITLCLIIE